MDKSKFRFSRFFFSLVLISFSIFGMVFRASAANIQIIDFQNYMSVIDVTTDEMTIMVTFRPDDFQVRWNLYDGSWNELSTLLAPSGELRDYGSPGNYILKYYPTGYYAYLDLSYIPTGTLISLSFDGGLSDGGVGSSYDTTNLRSGVALMFYDENFKKVGSTVYKYIDSTSVYSLNGTFSLDKPDGAVYLRIDNLWRDFVPDTPSVFVDASDLVLKFTLPMSVIDQIEDDQTQDLLQKILDELTASSNGASGDLVDQVGSQSGQLGQITDVMDGVNRPNVGDINVSIDQYITEDMMTSHTPLLALILDLPIVTNMLMLLLCMAFVSYVLFGKRG